MKRILFLVVLFLVMASAASADRIVSDPSTALIGAEYEVWQAAKNLVDDQVVATGKLIVTKAYETDGSVSYVTDSLVPGSYYWYFRSSGKAYVYGPTNIPGGTTVYSAFVPFAFTKRTLAVGSTTGLKLAP